jgi:hypothetical protein
MLDYGKAKRAGESLGEKLEEVNKLGELVPPSSSSFQVLMLTLS